jgi:two-component system, NtrC family, sensor kinase
MYNLEKMTPTDMFACGAALRVLHEGCSSMEEVSSRTVNYLFENLAWHADEQACVLVRLFKTHPYGALEPELKSHVDRTLGKKVDPETKCLVLLGSAGIQPNWSSRRFSVGHKAIPLASPEAVASLPMVSQLINQLGLTVSSVLKPNKEIILDASEKTFGVFHVPEALGSPIIGAQHEFVEPYKVRSVLGYGGMLPSGDLFAVILFSRASISKQTAQFFQSLALHTKTALLHFDNGVIFSPRA